MTIHKSTKRSVILLTVSFLFFVLEIISEFHLSYGFSPLFAFAGIGAYLLSVQAMKAVKCPSLPKRSLFKIHLFRIWQALYYLAFGVFVYLLLVVPQLNVSGVLNDHFWLLIFACVFGIHFLMYFKERSYLKGLQQNGLNNE